MGQNLDLLIFAVYAICIIYVLYNSVESLEKQTTIQVDQASLNQELANRTFGDLTLNDIVGISFKFEKRYRFVEQPKTLSVSINNKSTTISIRVDWDRSTLTNYENRSRRVIRLPPNKRIDLSQRQTFSTIAPGGSLQETITAEDVLKPQDNGTLEANAPIVDILKLQEDAKSRKATQKLKNTVVKFMKETIPLKFSLLLALQLFDWTDDEDDDRLYFVPCHFTIRKVPWIDYLPFNPKS